MGGPKIYLEQELEHPCQGSVFTHSVCPCHCPLSQVFILIK